MEEKAKKIVDAVLKELLGRSGFDGAWDGIDDGIRAEIREDLETAVTKVLTD